MPPALAETPFGAVPALSDRRDALIAWFDHAARDLPWRHDRSPYRVWVSETMLQQTRAATVVPYFQHWMGRFPDVSALARANESEVLATWEGLGYYRRARALHAAAKVVVADRDRRFPDDEAGWRALPGVGPYTAAAVSALAFGRRCVAVDGNVRRLGARLLATKAPRDDVVANALLPLLPDDEPARGTEALIELGAMVCTPRAPDCPSCPLAPACAGRAEGTPTAFPTPRPRKRPNTCERWALVASDPVQGVWLIRRPANGLLGGLWGFEQRDARPDSGRELAVIEQTYTHLHLRLRPVLVSATGHLSDPPGRADGAPEARWVAPTELPTLPLSRVDRRLLSRLRAEGLLAF